MERLFSGVALLLEVRRDGKGISSWSMPDQVLFLLLVSLVRCKHDRFHCPLRPSGISTCDVKVCDVKSP